MINSSAPKRALITGITGQDGSYLAELGASYVNTLLFPPILALRLMQRLRSASPVTSNGSADVFMPASLVNNLLYALLRVETRLLNFVDLPFGVGLFALARKPRTNHVPGLSRHSRA
jgi:hypothetical protein